MRLRLLRWGESVAFQGLIASMTLTVLFALGRPAPSRWSYVFWGVLIVIDLLWLIDILRSERSKPT